MTYVDELAREMHNASCPKGPAFEALSPARAAIYRSEIKRVLAAIAALAERGGPKLVRRDPTAEMSATNGSIYWEDLFDAAPAVPEEAE